MLQVEIHGPGDLRLSDIEPPIPGEHDLILRVEACGICGSDLSYVEMGGLGGDSGISTMPLGHEFSGVVESVGSAVRGIFRGQRIVVDPMRANDTGNGGPEGAFTPCLLVRNAEMGVNVHEVPTGMSFECAALVEPLAVAMHAVNVAAPRDGDRVVVYGAGCIGLGVLLVLRHRGVENVTVIDLSDERLRRARDIGALSTLNPARDDVLECLRESHGSSDVFGIPVSGATLFIEATGSSAAFEEIVRIAGAGARIVVVALHKKPASMDLQQLMMKELTVRGSIGYPNEFPDVIAMLTDPRVDTSPLISHRFDLKDFLHAFAVARDSRQSAKVMITCSG